MNPGSSLPPGPYGAILADPPWSFRAWSPKGNESARAPEQHYEVMTLGNLAALPVAASAAPDCALFMWVVDSHLEQGLALMGAWGFQYKTMALTWVKCRRDGTGVRSGMGYWTRKGAEVCLLGTRGKPRRMSRGVPQVIVEPRREMSRKPDEAYRRIERLVPGPYLEMFARQTRPGWDSWGNEVDKFAPPPRLRTRAPEL